MESTPAGRHRPTADRSSARGRRALLGTSLLGAAALIGVPRLLSGRPGEGSGAPGGIDSVEAAATDVRPGGDRKPDPAAPKRQFRALWVTTVGNTDWPTRKGLPVERQKKEFVSIVEYARKLNLNALLVHVRPAGDTFWPSKYAPWSWYLTGTEGKDPGYDPLKFMVEECHRRNIEFHAWMNPFRGSVFGDQERLSANHPARRRPELFVRHGDQLYYDPGNPAARRYALDTMLECVANYDVDGLHWDDFFYPYPGDGPGDFADDASWQRHRGAFTDKGDWRRHNVDTMIRDVHHALRATKPWVRFGISPFGIWRNKENDPAGSATSGLESYGAISADSRAWIHNGWLDYVVPQLYWRIGDRVADYATLVPWWAHTVKHRHVNLYIGQPAYRVGESAAWRDAGELARHLDLNRRHPEVKGDVYFTTKNVVADPLGATTRLRERHYSRPALVPATFWLADPAGEGVLRAPLIVSAKRDGDGLAVTWRPTGPRPPTSYAVYRFDGNATVSEGDFADARHLVAVVRATSTTTQTWIDTTGKRNETYTYYVTAVDRLSREGKPGTKHVAAA